MSTWKTIPGTTFRYFVVVILTLVLPLGSIWIIQYYNESKSAIAQFRGQSIQLQKERLREQVSDVIEFIEYKRSLTETRTRESLRNRAYDAHAIASRIYDQFHGQIPDERIRALIREALRPVRFNHGRGYYFAVAMDGIEQLFADRPEFEGQNMLGMQDTRGAYVIRDMIELVRERDEGFYSYTWTKPEAAGRDYLKVSFLKYFAPLDWFFGTGEYLDDMERDLRMEALERLRRKRFGEHRYVLIVQSDGVIQSHRRPDLIGRELSSLADENTNDIPARLLEIANNGSGFVEYDSPKLGSEERVPKILFFERYEPWGWIVATSIDLDGIEQLIADKTASLENQIGWTVFRILLGLFAGTGIALLISIHFSRRLKSEFDVFSRFFASAEQADAKIAVRELAFDELKVLAESTNTMLERRALMEDALKESTQVSRDILNSIPSGVYIYQFEPPDRFVLLDANPAAEQLTGITAKEWRGKEFNEMWPEARKSGIAEACLSVVKTGETVQVEELHYEDERLAGAFAMYVFLMPSERVGVAFENITERKVAERERAKLEEQLRQAQKMEAVGQLAGGIAHDFNNLLQGVLGYSEMAKSGLLPDDRRFQDMEQVVKAAKRAATLTRQLLAFSRRQMIRPENIDLRRLIEDLSEMLRRVIGEHIALNLKLADNTGTVHADPGTVEQILMNLCVNARDAMPSGGEIVIETDRVTLDETFCQADPTFNEKLCQATPWVAEGDYTLLSVTDSGTGMPSDVTERIFEPFFTTKDVGKGTGLGLSMVYGIVKQHRGIIHCDSELGKGTCFKIYLPSAACVEATDGPQRGAPARTRGAETILLAEDEELVRNLAARVLRENGYQVLVARDGQEALHLFDEHREDIQFALLDVVMPKVGGREVYSAIHAKKPEIPILFSSGYSKNAIHPGFVLEEGAETIQKPYSPDTLLGKVRELLDA